MVKHLHRLRVVYVEDIKTTMVTSTNNDGPILGKLYHLHVKSLIWYFETPRWGGSLDRIQVVPGSHVIDDNILPLWADIQIPAERSLLGMGEPVRVSKWTYMGDWRLRGFFFSAVSQSREILAIGLDCNQRRQCNRHTFLRSPDSTRSIIVLDQ